jgi:hypothetical protein
VTREELLQQLGIGDADFNDFLGKISAFRNSLNSQQLALFDRITPSVSQLLTTFGAGATASAIESLMSAAPAVHGIAANAWLVPGPPPPPPPPPPPGGDEESGS